MLEFVRDLGVEQSYLESLSEALVDIDPNITNLLVSKLQELKMIAFKTENKNLDRK